MDISNNSMSIGAILGLLESMKGPPWTKALFTVYTIILDRIDADLRYKAVTELAGEEWRPAPNEILRHAARLELRHASGTEQPYPSADDAYAEIMWKVREFGLYGRVVPDRPNLRLAGPPPFSHPLVARTVAMIGGWEAICSGEANYAEGLSKQVKTIYERQAASWTNKVADMLLLPPHERDPSYFPAWTPYEVPEGWEEPRPPLRLVGSQGQSALPPAPVPMPDSVRTLWRRLGIPPPDEAPAPDADSRDKEERRRRHLERAKLRQLEAELVSSAAGKDD